MNNSNWNIQTKTENLDIVKRIADRGLAYSQNEEDSTQVDLWQHLLDELERI